MDDTLYVTTPIYYVNDVPHLGHAYTTVLADVLARFGRSRKKPTRFLTGTDEHGQKIEEAAKQRNLAPLAHADLVVERFAELWKNLDISNDDFIRTTEARHKQVVVELWKRLVAAGDIYLGDYEDWYCVACEAFYTEKQLDPGNCCPVHKAPVGRIKEQSYFFRMSKYQDALLAHIESNPDFILPEMRRNEIVSFIRTGLRDLSVSRTTFSWGIPVPGDPRHVIYVWVDALTNYLSALGGFKGDLYERFWPHSVHLIGKDILRFHAVYWPCLLMAAGLPLPKHIVAHGWWTVRGEKISKSLPATRIDPNAIIAELGADALRYFLVREVPLGLDGDFVYESLLGRWNSDLANDLGNLLSRTVGMAAKGGPLDAGGADPTLEAIALGARKRAEAHMEAFEPSRALEAIWELVRAANGLVANRQPYRLPEEEKRQVLATLAEAIRWCAKMLWPVLPSSTEAMMETLGLAKEEAHAWPTTWHYPGSTPQPGKPMFPKVDAKAQIALLDKWLPQSMRAPSPEQAGAAAPAQAAKPAPAQAAMKAAAPSEITMDDVAKLDLRIGVIAAAEKHPKADRLLVLQVDIGEGKNRQIVAGIAEQFAPASLPGRRCLFVCNLAPATLRGVRSEGMLLVADAAGKLALLSPAGGPAGEGGTADLPPGTRVR